MNKEFNDRYSYNHGDRVIRILATEMKSYARTLTGSVFSVDRRTDERPPVYDTCHPSIHDAAGDDE